MTSELPSPSLHPVTLDGQVVGVFDEAAKVFRPPAKMTVTEWAEAERVISQESGSFGGRYHVSLTPYQRGMQDAIHIPGVQEVVYFLPSQMGKSTCMENIFGYFVDTDPCSIIWMWPTDKVAKEWSDDTLEPLIRDTPALARKFSDASRKSSNRTLAKRFPGGWLAIIGANSPAGLRRRRARVIIADEIDGMPQSAGNEGDPIGLVEARSETYWDRLKIEGSTCTEKGESRIEARYEISNKQKYWVPCPHCTEAAGHLDGFQVLIWEKLVFDKVPPHTGTVYPCALCGVALTELNKPWMLEYGEWRAGHPEIVAIQGFWLNKLYSPFVTWAELVARHAEAMAELRGGNREIMKKFTTLDLARTWEERDEDLDRDGLARRCENYQRKAGYEYPVLPDGVTVLTCAVDVQEDRLELEVVGWGRARESWSILTKVIEGAPTEPFSNDPSRSTVWNKLDQFLETEFLHHRGITLPIAATFIDSGFHANDVYNYTKPRAYRRIFACKGSSDFKHVPLGKKKKTDRSNVWLFMVGSSQIKKQIYAWLRILHPGPGFMHFDKEFADEAYFAQLTCEHLEKKYVNGYTKHYWEKPKGARNEALDLKVYNYAAFLSLSEKPDQMLEGLRSNLMKQARELAERLAKNDNPDQLKLISDDPPPVPAAEPTPQAATAVDPPPVSSPESNSGEKSELTSAQTPEKNKNFPRRIRSSWATRF